MSGKRNLSSWLVFVLAAGALVALAVARAYRRAEPPPPSTQAAGTDFVPVPPDLELHYDLVDKIDSGLEKLRGIAIGANDDLYLAGADAVKVLAADGKPLREWTISGAATCVAVDAGGNVYVGQRTRVEVFDNQGKLIRTWGTEGKNAGEFRYVTGIAVHGANVFVADAGNRCIHRFDTTGDFIDDLGKRDKEKGVDGLICPSAFLDVIVDDEGVLFVTNPGRSRVEQYKSDGTLIRSWGRAGAQPERFFGCCNPTNLALLPNDHIVTAEKLLPRVKVYDIEGTLLAYIAPEHFTKKAEGLDLAVDSEGRIFVTDPGSGQVSVFAPKEKRGTGNRDGATHGQ